MSITLQLNLNVEELRGELPDVINKRWRAPAIHDAKTFEVGKQGPQSSVSHVPFATNTQQHFLLEPPLIYALYSHLILTQNPV